LKRLPITPLALCVVAVLLSTCSSDSGFGRESRIRPQEAPKDTTFDVFVVNSDLAIGTNFLVLAVRGSDGSFRGSKESTATIEARRHGQREEAPHVNGAAFTADAPFIETSQEGRGVYGTRVTFPVPGTWDLLVRFTNPEPGGLPVQPVPTVAVVAEKSQAPSRGEPAPRSHTKTLASEGGDFTRVTSDFEPDPDLYAHSLDEVIGSGVPVVVMFATPLRCRSAVCGPALEQLKKAKVLDPGAYYIHVDVYEKPRDPSDETYVQAVHDWRLPTEPMTFVVTPKGYVYDRFEGPFLPSQLLRSLEEARAAE